jgi:hypothetical protein
MNCENGSYLFDVYFTFSFLYLDYWVFCIDSWGQYHKLFTAECLCYCLSYFSGMCKRTSLPRHGINYDRKKLYDTGSNTLA